MGTLTAALVLFLGGVLVGAIDDVPTEVWLSALGGLAGVLVGIYGAISSDRRLRRVERSYDGVERSYEEILARLSELLDTEVAYKLAADVARQKREQRAREDAAASDPAD